MDGSRAQCPVPPPRKALAPVVESYAKWDIKVFRPYPICLIFRHCLIFSSIFCVNKSFLVTRLSILKTLIFWYHSYLQSLSQTFLKWVQSVNIIFHVWFRSKRVIRKFSISFGGVFPVEPSFLSKNPNIFRNLNQYERRIEEEKISDNLGHNILKLWKMLVEVWFNISKVVLDM